MNCKIRKWKLTDAKDIAVALSNKKIQDNLRDGLPYPYSEQDGIILYQVCFQQTKMKHLHLRLHWMIK